MATFLIALFALIGGYLIYGKIVDNIFQPTDKPTPALIHNDGVSSVFENVPKSFKHEHRKSGAFFIPPNKISLQYTGGVS